MTQHAATMAAAVQAMVAACDEAIEQLLAGEQAERLPVGMSTTDTDGDPGVDRIMENVVIDGQLRGVACDVRTDRDGPGPVERVYLRAPWPEA